MCLKIPRVLFNLQLIFLQKMTTIWYGTDENYVNVTDICAENVNDDGKFDIPKTDLERSFVFGDPVVNVEKQIRLHDREGVITVLKNGTTCSVLESDLEIVEKKYKLTIASLFRDSAFYLKEWIEFHLLIGVEHFYLGNHCSIDHYLEILQPYINVGIVELVMITDPIINQFEEDVHKPFMNRAIRELKSKTEWLALIDVDEFITPMLDVPIYTCDDSRLGVYHLLMSLKKKYKTLGGIAVNWVCYGNSNIKMLKNDEFMLEKMNYRSSLNDSINTHIKCIVWCNVTSGYHIHNCTYVGSYKTFDVNGNVVNGSYTALPSVNKLRLTHYNMADLYYYHFTKFPFYVEYWLSARKLPPKECKTINEHYSDCSRNNVEIDNYMCQFSAILRQKNVTDLRHYENDSTRYESLRVLYGVHGALKDVTNIVLDCCTKNNKITILPGDTLRASIFGDPIIGTIKHVFVSYNWEIKVYSEEDTIEINLK